MRDLRRQETLEPADALDLAELLLDPLFQRLVPVLQLLGLLLQLAGLLLHGGVRGRQLAALLVHFGEQPRIAHRQHRLVRKGLHQPDQVRREFAGVPAQHHQRAEHALSGRPAAPPAPNGSRPRSRRRAADARRPVSRSAIAIGSPLRGGSPSMLPSASMARWPPSASLSMPIASVRLKWRFAGVIAVDQHRIGMGDLQRARGHRRQHGVEIERGGDRAADLLQHLQLVDRLREIAGSLLHLAFEVRNRSPAAGRPCC